MKCCKMVHNVTHRIQFTIWSIAEVNKINSLKQINKLVNWLIYTTLQKLGFIVGVSQGFNIFGLTWTEALSVRQIKISVVLRTPMVRIFLLKSCRENFCHRFLAITLCWVHNEGNLLYNKFSQ